MHTSHHLVPVQGSVVTFVGIVKVLAFETGCMVIKYVSVTKAK